MYTACKFQASCEYLNTCGSLLMNIRSEAIVTDTCNKVAPCTAQVHVHASTTCLPNQWCHESSSIHTFPVFSHLQLHRHEVLVLVMAYDFQKERFSLKLPREDVDKIPVQVVQVARALWQHKVKLSATLARMRVKENAQSITQLIPNPSVRQRYQAMLRQPCYARVNMIKVDNIQAEVISGLQNEGYTVVATREQFWEQKKAVRHLRRDLLEFSIDCRGTLDCLDLVKNGYIILQVLNIAVYTCLGLMQTLIIILNSSSVLWVIFAKKALIIHKWLGGRSHPKCQLL